MAGNSVFVLDKHHQPLMPCHPARARELLRKKKAVVHRLAPFTIRLTQRIGGAVQPIVLGIDPGSKTTGLAIAREKEGVRISLWLGELAHRGDLIRKKMGQRAGYRRRRRSKNLRYRAPRFKNRVGGRKFAPSLQHRLDTTMSWVCRLLRFVPVMRVAMERVRFDMAKMQNAEVSGVEYQQRTLLGYEVKEYLLEKWGRTCVYCDAENQPLETEHVVARANGGSDRVSNLVPACRPCNQKKGTKPLAMFLRKDPARQKKIEAQLKQPLKDAAAVNATRWELGRLLLQKGLPVEFGTGGRTKFNRTRFGLPKTHALDALCVGEMQGVAHWSAGALCIKAMGRGAYQRTRVDKQGFQRGFLMRQKRVHGFQTGDRVKAVVCTGKKRGTYHGRVAVRASGSFNLQGEEAVQGISHRFCRLLQRADGYDYATRTGLLPVLKDGVSALKIR